MSISYQAESRQKSWIAGSRVVLDLKIANNGATAIEVPDPAYRNSPQPVFELTRPDASRLEFRPSQRAREGDGNMPVQMVRIEPGQSWESDLALSLFASIEAPGAYVVRSWIELNGSRWESAPSRFEVVESPVSSLATETSLSPEGSAVVECVQLLRNGMAASTILDEEDSKHGELAPLHRIGRGSAKPDSTILGAYSNITVGLSPIRWVLTEADGAVKAGHNLSDASVDVFAKARAAKVLRPLWTKAGLFVPAILDSHLAVAQVTATHTSVAAGEVRKVVPLETEPAGGASTLAPESAGSNILVALVWGRAKDSQLRFFSIDTSGKLIARGERDLPGWNATGDVAVGWSTRGELRITVTARAADSPRELKAMEFRLLPDLTVLGGPQISPAVKLDSLPKDIHMDYFEQSRGQLNRMILVRTESGQVWVLPQGKEPRQPHSEVPALGPLTILPGRSLWYAAWSTEKGLYFDVL